MHFSSAQAEVFLPDDSGMQAALARTTDLCIAAHHDDIEIMAYAPIAACFHHPERFFTGCVVCDGAGSPREGAYAEYTDEMMMRTRVAEQKNAARIGRYSAQVLLGLPSAQIKDAGDKRAVDDLEELLLATQPQAVYTHNLADKHDTHIAVTLRAIEAIRRLPAEKRPAKVYSMEVWRGLDWLCDGDKTTFDTSPHPSLAGALLGVFDSQVSGGKRYDSAAIGRRLANATFFASHNTDICESLSYALDITPLAHHPTAGPEAFIKSYIQRFEAEVLLGLQNLQ